MPDAHDQGGILVQVPNGASVRRWRIDTSEERLPAYLVPFAQEVKKAAVAELK